MIRFVDAWDVNISYFGFLPGKAARSDLTLEQIISLSQPFLEAQNQTQIRHCDARFFQSLIPELRASVQAAKGAIRRAIKYMLRQKKEATNRQ